MLFGQDQYDPSFRRRRRGTAIVVSDLGVLVNAMVRGPLILPGGGAHRGESRLRAAIRELEEETRLKAVFAVELFEYIGVPNHRFHYQDHHKIVYIVATGSARPGHEVAAIRWYRKDGAVTISHESARIISMYESFRAERSAFFDSVDTFTSTLEI